MVKLRQMHSCGSLDIHFCEPLIRDVKVILHMRGDLCLLLHLFYVHISRPAAGTQC